MGVVVYTDGSCLPNSKGWGGWGAVILFPEEDMPTVISGAKRGVTNNQMELLAVIRALEYIPLSHESITVYTDSAYINNCLRCKWYKQWQANGWMASTGKPVKNREYWEELLYLATEQRHVEFHHVKGHSGDKYNELADSIARTASVEAEVNDRLSQ